MAQKPIRYVNWKIIERSSWTPSNSCADWMEYRVITTDLTMAKNSREKNRKKSKSNSNKLVVGSQHRSLRCNPQRH